MRRVRFFRWIVVGCSLFGVAFPAGAGVKFRFPSPDRALFASSVVLGMDHDGGEGTSVFGAGIRCENYEGKGFPHCYNGHEGTDYLLLGGFETMDAGSARVVAAAAGWVTAAEDGNYDRCHAAIRGRDVTCDGHPIAPNFVAIEHPDGLVTYYFHLKKGSVLVEVGQWVECGTPLGLVGSSGYSSLPHLHFGVTDAEGNPIDPYHRDPAESLWVVQDGGDGFPGGECAPSPALPEPHEKR